MRIAIDFDGTIVTHRYPEIGEPIPFAIESLLQIQALGHQLVLWTVREGRLLDEAVAYCRERGLIFYAVNRDHPEESADCGPRKLSVDLFIDDRNFGGMPDWGLICQTLAEGDDASLSADRFYGNIKPASPPKKRKKWFSGH